MFIGETGVEGSLGSDCDALTPHTGLHVQDAASTTGETDVIAREIYTNRLGISTMNINEHQDHRIRSHIAAISRGSEE